jgi:hypothetical protein
VSNKLQEVLRDPAPLLEEWPSVQLAAGGKRGEQTKPGEVREQGVEMLRLFTAAVFEDWERIERATDELGLYTTELHRLREEVVQRQQQDMTELSTPVVTLWSGVLALPLIGTLDSARTQLVMESLLQRIVDTGSQFAIVADWGSDWAARSGSCRNSSSCPPWARAQP